MGLWAEGSRGVSGRAPLLGSGLCGDLVLGHTSPLRAAWVAFSPLALGGGAQWGQRFQQLLLLGLERKGLSWLSSPSEQGLQSHSKRGTASPSA